MNKAIKLIFLPILVVLLWTSCGEYARVQKSTDVMEKYSYAKKYYNTGKYSRSVALLEEIYNSLQNRKEGEQVLFLLGESYLNLKNYELAHQAFQKYYTNYPSGEFAEEARFKSGNALYMDSPDARLDQTITYAAIKEMQLYLDYYPQGKYSDRAKNVLFELQEKLAYKELLAARLYYNLGNYLFNNYQSCIITAKNAIKDYPYTQYKEDLHYLIVASLYEIAYNSIESKKSERIRDLRDEYYNYLNEFPEGKYLKKMEKFSNYFTKALPDEGDLLDEETDTTEE